MGWLGIHLDERHGGAGAGLAELVVVLEEVGRQVAPGPFLPTVLASAVIAQCGTDGQRDALLPGLADGSAVAALGLGGSLTLRMTTCSTVTVASCSAAPQRTCSWCDPETTSSCSGRTRRVSASARAKDLDPSRRSARVTVSSSPVHRP